MHYTNFDSRIKGGCQIPEDRLKLLRDLEKKVRNAREIRRLARLGVRVR